MAQHEHDDLLDNTIATVENTRVTEVSNQSGGISKLTAVVAGLLLATVCFVSYINKDFANQQAGLILSGVVGGLFGAAVAQRK